MTPTAWQPVQDLLQARQAGASLHLHLGEAAAGHTSHQTLYWFHVVGHQDPPAALHNSKASEDNCCTQLPACYTNTWSGKGVTHAITSI